MSSTSEAKEIFQSIVHFIKERFNLMPEQEDAFKTIDSIKKGISFRGTKLWILIFAIMVASVGLNTNSTAVIIGAMLISPLMGPIMGVGLALGIYDFDLFKKSLINLLIASIVSIIVSALYFFISPVNVAHSELLARTNPTIYDVLIALFGGFARIVAGASVEKGNVIPGVAIATALMPPLCTVGYGIGTMQPIFIFGALYLYIINSTFIALSTFLLVKSLKFPKVKFLNSINENRIHRIIIIVIVAIIVPSIFTAYNMVQSNYFESRANQFINEQFNQAGTIVVNKDFKYNRSNSYIKVTLYGNKIDSSMIDSIITQMPKYRLKRTKLYVLQGEDQKIDIDFLKQSIESSIYENMAEKTKLDLLKEKDLSINQMNSQLQIYKPTDENFDKIYRELKIYYPDIKSIYLSRSIRVGDLKADSLKYDTLDVALIDFTSSRVRQKTIKQIQNWLQLRLDKEDIQIITY